MGSAEVQGPLWGTAAQDWAELAEPGQVPFYEVALDAIYSVQYASDATAALREVKRVAKAGSPVAIATWGPVEQCEMRVVLAAIGAMLPPPPPGAAGPFALAAPGALEALVESAGLSAERAIDVKTPYIYPDLKTAVRAQLSSGPARMAIKQAGPEEVSAALVGAFGTVTQPDGSIRLDNVFKVVIART